MYAREKGEKKGGREGQEGRERGKFLRQIFIFTIIYQKVEDLTERFVRLLCFERDMQKKRRSKTKNAKERYRGYARAN